MIKRILIEYCEANEKYDSYIDGVYTGKWYTLEHCLKSHISKVENWDKLKAQLTKYDNETEVKE